MEVSLNDKNASLINLSASSVRMQLAKLKNTSSAENDLNKGDMDKILDRRSVSSGGIFSSNGAATARNKLNMNKTSQNYGLDRNREYKEQEKEKESDIL